MSRTLVIYNTNNVRGLKIADKPEASKGISHELPGGIIFFVETLVVIFVCEEG